MQVMAYKLKPVQFVRPVQSDWRGIRHSQDESGSHLIHDAQAGENTKAFYESVISTTPTQNQSKNCDGQKPRKPIRHRKKRSNSNSMCSSVVDRNDSNMQSGSNIKLVNELLRHSQEGNLSEVKKLLKIRDCNLEGTDQYGWNALMCAAYSGHLELVNFFLTKSISLIYHTDKKGQSALDLAKTAGHQSVIQLLEQCESSMSLSPGSRQKRTDQETNHQEPFWCEACQSEICETSRDAHQRSTSHLFSCQHAPKSTLYHIPESNRGFQMMLQDGWDKEKGLGREGTGPKFPVKTTLKRDRQGLGTKDNAAKPRITHFKPFDVEAVKKPKKVDKKLKMRTSVVDKRTRTRKEKKQKAWEINFRQSFHTQS